MLLEGMKLTFQEKIISIVGGGGKTSLILRLAEELGVEERIIITSTTNMELLCPKKIDKIIISQDLDEIKNEIYNLSPGDKRIFVAGEKIKGNKVKGILPEWVDIINDLPGVEGVLVEADGANKKPLKGGFLETEPVIPRNTDLLVFVAGVDAVNKKLTEEHIHRAELAAKITGLPLGEVLKEGYFRKIIDMTSLRAKQMAYDARLILFLNKVDTEKEMTKILPVAKKLASGDRVKFDRVVLGSLKSLQPIQKIL